MGLGRGDLLVLYTDGITEAMALRRAKSAKLFGVEKAGPGAAGGWERGGGAWSAHAEVERFTEGGAAGDDRTLIAIRCG